jgi:hypothetical protein
VLQNVPDGAQLVVPHTLALQTPLQQSLAFVQGAPSVKHAEVQTPALQCPQQSESVRHAMPSREQLLHLPLWQLPLQHSVVVEQALPATTQAAHVPLVQLPWQHCESIVHVAPSAAQAQLPLAQWLLQHWLSKSHLMPMSKQAHFPLLQS